jgi:P-type conjugative transfer protein TrbJ
MKKKLGVVMILLFLTCSSALAFGGGSSAAMVSILKRMETVQMTMKLDQLEQLKKDLLNIQSINSSLSTGNMQQISNGLQYMLKVQNEMTSAISDYSNFQKEFQGIYSDFVDFKNMTPDQYIQKADEILNNTKKILNDGMKTVGINNPERISNDTQLIQNILKTAATAEGQKEVLQATVNMAGAQTQMLMELRTLMAQSLNSQNAFMMKDVQDEGAVAQRIKEAGEITKFSTGKGADVTSGFKE